eukprot:TRINITY_DN525_c0_g1_i1.p1 TRINITY_DN525_c0_g1~~TRINITY_DN525_c0_g1_i1.p1  ORF type:complete len:520 (+),score=147.45 TRINITY_DN525_c0_g1_i1:118-1677(+)
MFEKRIRRRTKSFHLLVLGIIAGFMTLFVIFLAVSSNNIEKNNVIPWLIDCNTKEEIDVSSTDSKTKENTDVPVVPEDSTSIEEDINKENIDNIEKESLDDPDFEKQEDVEEKKEEIEKKETKTDPEPETETKIETDTKTESETENEKEKIDSDSIIEVEGESTTEVEGKEEEIAEESDVKFDAKIDIFLKSMYSLKGKYQVEFTDTNLDECDTVGDITFDPQQLDLIDPEKNSNLPPIPTLGFPTIINPYFIERAVYSIDYPVKKLFIGWNGNYENIRCAIRRIKRNLGDLVEIKQYPENLGVSPVWNEIAMADEKADYFIMSNDDVKLLPGTLKAVAQHMESLKNKNGELPPIIYGSKAQSENHPMWESFLSTRTAYERIGAFDENFFPMYYEDNDYDFRSAMAGVNKRQLDVFKIHHGWDDAKDYISGTRFDHRGALNDNLKRQIERSPSLYGYIQEKFGRNHDWKHPFNNKANGPGYWTYKWDRPYLVRSGQHRANANYYKTDNIYASSKYSYKA